MIGINKIPNQRVALRKESVDRNIHVDACALFQGVALRKESVDRNYRSAIENQYSAEVALRKESVDRNLCHSQLFGNQVRRSPQGERG